MTRWSNRFFMIRLVGLGSCILNGEEFLQNATPKSSFQKALEIESVKNSEMTSSVEELKSNKSSNGSKSDETATSPN